MHCSRCLVSRGKEAYLNQGCAGTLEESVKFGTSWMHFRCFSVYGHVRHTATRYGVRSVTCHSGSSRLSETGATPHWKLWRRRLWRHNARFVTSKTAHISMHLPGLMFGSSIMQMSFFSLFFGSKIWAGTFKISDITDSAWRKRWCRHQSTFITAFRNLRKAPLGSTSARFATARSVIFNYAYLCNSPIQCPSRKS